MPDSSRQLALPSTPPCTLTVTTASNTPAFVSRFASRKYAKAEAVISNVLDYFAVNWPWTTPEQQDKFIKQDAELFTLCAMPDALDDRIELAVLLLDVLFLTDDIMDHWSHDQAKVFCSHFQGLVLGTSAPSAESQVEVVIASLYKRFRDTEVTESNSYHLITDFCNYTCTWFSTLTRTGRANDIHELESYLEYRFFDSGASLTMAMVRWTSNFSVPAYMRKDPSVKLVEVTAGCQAALVNDICSYRREVSIMSQKGAGEISKNIVNAVVLIMKEMNLDEKEAIKYLWEYVSQLEERFLNAVEKAKARYSGVDLETLEKYANALELMCRGNLTWSTFCGRYNHFA